jgi:hypothetical protein
MKKSLILLCLILVVLLFVQAGAYIRELQEQDKIIAELQTELQARQQVEPIEQYTMITNLCSSMYVNSVTVDTDNAVYWTDVNGVSGFDITVGTTHYRYVEGHIEARQINLYAPYLYVEENIFD